MILLPLLLAAAQRSDHSTDRLPPANPLPMGEDAPAAVLEPVRAIVGARSAAEILARVRPDGGVTLVSEAADGRTLVTQLGWRDYAALADGRTQERLTDPAVEVDGAAAMVWSPYVVTVAGRVVRCGIEHAALVREDGRWRVATLTRSDRTTGCDER